jgi:hypothetical protein
MKYVLVIISALQATSPNGAAQVRVTNVTPIDDFSSQQACIAVRNYVRMHQASSTAECWPKGSSDVAAR